MNETRELLERVGERFTFPPHAFEGLERRRHRKRRNQRITAGAVGIAVFVTMVWIATTGGPLDRSDTPAVIGPPTPPGVTVIDQTFIDSINNCERLLVTPQQVESALGFPTNDPTPFDLGGTPYRYGVADPLSTGCEYASLDLVPDLGQPVMGHEGLGGELVITAYMADAPPPPLGRSVSVRGIGDAATFSSYGNGDEHLLGSEGATSVLEVRSGDLVLRFNGGSFDVDGNVVVRPLTGYPLPALRQLAESALATLDEMPVVGPTGHAASTSPTDARRTRTVEGIAFSFSAHHSWADGPIKGLAEGGFRQGHLLISKSIVGPQGAEAVIFWTGVSGGPRAELCGEWRDPADDTVADLATAVATAPGIELVRGPSDVTVGGYPAKHVVVIARQEVFCDPGFFYEWYSECWGPCWTESNLGDTIRVWIVDVDGTPLFFEAETTAQANQRLVQEIQRIIGSIRFG